jgi:hypothetical protein
VKQSTDPGHGHAASLFQFTVALVEFGQFQFSQWHVLSRDKIRFVPASRRTLKIFHQFDVCSV